MAEFVRLAEVVNKKKDMRVVSVTVAPTISDCSGRIWITDLQLQEGPNPVGYAPHTETLLKKYRENGEIVPSRFFNGLVRSSTTLVIFNLGSTSAGLDVYVYPLEDMKAGSVGLSQGVGGQRVSFPNALAAGDELVLKASTRECTRNGVPERKEGFFQYSAAWDSKHPITVEDGKSARLYVEFQEMQDGWNWCEGLSERPEVHGMELYGQCKNVPGTPGVRQPSGYGGHLYLFRGCDGNA